MNNPGFIVEGDLEKLFIEETCPGRPVRKIGCNGYSVQISEIARRVGTQARMLQKKCDLIVVIFDRESRIQQSHDIENTFSCEISKENIDCSIVVGIPDRHIENWILADWEGFCRESGAAYDKKPMIEGSKGKSLLKSLLLEGAKYIETLHGVKWLKKADSSKIAQNSPSFDRFAQKLLPLQCWWLHKEKLESVAAPSC